MAARILVIEDEEEIRRDLVDELLENGYLVDEAALGEEALALAAAQRPDLVLCDVQMRGMNGFEIIRHLRAEPAGRADLPFIFVSAYGDAINLARGLEAGADRYLVKPVDYDELLGVIAGLLEPGEA